MLQLLRAHILASLAAFWCLAPVVVSASEGEGRRLTQDLTGPGWSLWLDREAAWKDDALFLPGTPLASIPVNPPTGGWQRLDAGSASAVAVPGTVEEYLGTGTGPQWQLQGVSWWFRPLTIPTDLGNRTVSLEIGSVSRRAEVFLDDRLVGYDLVGNAPFTIDLTGLVQAGHTHRLALRVTNQGGRYDWMDFIPSHWAGKSIPSTHAFTGILGEMTLTVRDPVAISDLVVRNTLDPDAVEVLAELANATSFTAARVIDLAVRELPEGSVVHQVQLPVVIPPGGSRVTLPVAVPGVRRWELDHPVLHQATATLSDRGTVTDLQRQRFGFRSFAIAKVDGDDRFHLNGKRVVLRTAISWGFWPGNGGYATPELAERQIRSAKALGLNMLNFHRYAGNRRVLDLADELGLLYYQEPGGYGSMGADPFGRALAREKLLRLVRRDRSHPSLVIWNLINEQWADQGADKDPALLAAMRRDLEDAHAVDPSKIVTFTSAWAWGPTDAESPAKMHRRPFETTTRLKDWIDIHNAVGPATWNDGFYRGPQDYFHAEAPRGPVVYYGEEGAISSPPRLERIVAELEAQAKAGHGPGWDGERYRDWYRQLDGFLTRKDLRQSFPTVDAFCTALGAISLYHQGRRIETHRLNDAVDGYAINGWEAELGDDHSGVVDCFRNPKADPAIVARYNRPCLVSVKARQQVAEAGGSVTVDAFAINEIGLSGPHTLRLRLLDSEGLVAWTTERPVTVIGGETFGQPLATGFEVPLKRDGLHRVAAELIDVAGAVRATGEEQVLSVAWRTGQVTGLIKGSGAVVETDDGPVRRFLAEAGTTVPLYRADLPRLDWVVVARTVAEPTQLVDARVVTAADGRPGWDAAFAPGKDPALAVKRRVDRAVSFTWDVGAGGPDPSVTIDHDYSARFSGTLHPPQTGRYRFHGRADDGIRLWVDGTVVLDGWKDQAPTDYTADVDLTAGKPVPIQLDYYQGGGGAEVHLRWQTPLPTTSIDGLARRCRDDGTTVVVLEDAEHWLDLIRPDPSVTINGKMDIGLNWVGGQYFVRPHPLFAGLPTACGLDWPYQAVIPERQGQRYGLRLEGEELVAGAWQSVPFGLGTTVGIVPVGKGRMLLSTLRVAPTLTETTGPALVARRLLMNWLGWAGAAR